MKKIIISKKEFRSFIENSINSFNHVFHLNLEQENKMENDETDIQSFDLYEQEHYLLGLSETGELIYTERATYIEFEPTVFFLVLDEEFLTSMSADELYKNDIELDKLSEYISILFKKEKKLDISIEFI